MSINVAQRPLGREFDGSGARIGFIAFCDAGEDETAVIAAVEAEAPASYLGFSRGDVSATEIGFDDAGDASVWDVEVPYGRTGGTLIPPPTGTVVWSGTTAGGTQHITSGLAPGSTFTDPSVSTLPADWGLAIGATKDGIAGIDITVPVDAFRATKYIAAASWPALRAVIKAITGTVNDDAWNADGETFQAGEVLFLGATWAKRTEVDPPDYEVTFEFAASPNVVDLDIGGILDIDKEGWDYLDLTYEDKEDEGFMVKKPIIATIHKVYRRANFGTLGL
ncbi:MAG: hypothetical protein KF678_15370 [Phycisphaeraceae bacterium]|nr:hypothetical protein [Phycisphaeraceae bacterium]